MANDTNGHVATTYESLLADAKEAMVAMRKGGSLDAQELYTMICSVKMLSKLMDGDEMEMPIRGGFWKLMPRLLTDSMLTAAREAGYGGSETDLQKLYGAIMDEARASFPKLPHERGTTKAN